MEAHFTSSQPYGSYDQQYSIQQMPHSICHGCGQLSSLVVALKDRISQLEIEKAVVSSEKVKVESSFQCIIGLLTSQRAAAREAGLQHRQLPCQLGGSSISSSLSASLGSDAPRDVPSGGLVPDLYCKEPGTFQDAAAGIIEPISTQESRSNPAPKPEAAWKETKPCGQQGDLIDLVDEGYISYFSNSDGRTLEVSSDPSILPSVNQSKKPNLDTARLSSIPDGDIQLLTSPSTNDGDEEDNVDDAGLFNGDAKERGLGSGFLVGTNKAPTLATKSISAAASFSEKLSSGAYGSMTANTGLDMSFPIKPKSDVNHLRYTPTVKTPDIFRTVLISDLPANLTSVAQILDQVRGGLVVDAKLLNKITFPGSPVALIQFLYEESAKRFVVHVSKYNIVIGDTKIKAALIETASRPIPEHLRGLILQGKCSRFMYIYRYPRNISLNKLREDMGMSTATKLSTVVYLKIKAGGIAEVCFTSVSSAQIARDHIVANGKYRDSPVRFGPDPCAAPYPLSMEETEHPDYLSDAAQENPLASNSTSSEQSVRDEGATEATFTNVCPVEVKEAPMEFMEHQDGHSIEKPTFPIFSVQDPTTEEPTEDGTTAATTGDENKQAVTLIKI